MIRDDDERCDQSMIQTQNSIAIDKNTGTYNTYWNKRSFKIKRKGKTKQLDERWEIEK